MYRLNRARRGAKPRPRASRGLPGPRQLGPQGPPRNDTPVNDNPEPEEVGDGTIQRQVLPQRPKSVGPGEIANNGPAVTRDNAVARPARKDSERATGK
eukprot:7574636-Alexandrium_andersonii.AAC.1